MARGFRLGSGVAKLLVPVAVVGAIGFLTWYLAINPSTRIVNLFGFLAPPPAATQEQSMDQGIPVNNQSPESVRSTGDFGGGFQSFAGATDTGEGDDIGSYDDDGYEKVSLSS